MSQSVCHCKQCVSCPVVDSLECSLEWTCPVSAPPPSSTSFLAQGLVFWSSAQNQALCTKPLFAGDVLLSLPNGVHVTTELSHLLFISSQRSQSYYGNISPRYHQKSRLCVFFSLIIIAYSCTQCYGNRILVQKYMPPCHGKTCAGMCYDLPIKTAHINSYGLQ